VCKMSAMGQPSWPTQPSAIPLGLVNDLVSMNYRGGDHRTADQAEYCCLVAGQSPWARTVAYRLYARSACDTKSPLQYATCGAK